MVHPRRVRPVFAGNQSYCRDKTSVSQRLGRIMIECRYCRDSFRSAPEKLGARCPTCRMPLYERDRHKAPAVDVGPCTLHQDKSAHGKCRRCGKLICSVCRTRWDDETVCPGCLDHILENEPSPQLARTQNRQANWSIAAAIMGWLLLVLTLLPLSSLAGDAENQGAASTAGRLFLASFVPAVCALGPGAACIRWRGRRLAVATWGVVLAGAQLGLMLGVMLFSVWLN